MDDVISLDGIFSQGYGFISKAVMRDKDIHIIAKGIYSYICSFSGKGKDSFPSQKLICNDLGISKDTLSKYLKQLVESGYIRIRKNKNKGRFANNVYSINMLPCPISSDTVRTDTETIGYGETYTNNNNTNNNNIYNNNSINIKNTKKDLKEQIEELNISFDLRDKFKEFIDYRKEIKKSLKTMRMIEGAIKKIGTEFKSEQHLIESIDHSMENEWLAIIPKKEVFKKKKTEEFKPANWMDIVEGGFK
jgi:biotin operon repressor